jgi:hypothetical protein
MLLCPVFAPLWVGGLTSIIILMPSKPTRETAGSDAVEKDDAEKEPEKPLSESSYYYDDAHGYEDFADEDERDKEEN